MTPLWIDGPMTGVRFMAEKAPKYSGWWRCRIKGRTNKYPWLYFKTECSNKRNWRRDARFVAQLHLRRVEFDFESVFCEPNTLQWIGFTDGVAIFADTTFALAVRS